MRFFRRWFQFTRQETALALLSLLLAALVAVPIVGVFSNLVGGGTLGVWQHLLDTTLPEYLRSTLILAVLVVSGVCIVGVTTAWCVVMYDFPGKRILEVALLLPLAVPAYVSAYAYTDFLQFAGPVQTLLREANGWQAGDYWFPDVRSLGGAALMFVVTLYPYVYLLARTAFLERSPSLLDAARTLGASGWRRFFHITLPLARPAMIAGASLVMMETLADYGTVSYFGVTTLTSGIYRAWFSLGDRAAAAQLASILLLCVFVLLWAELRARGRARFYASGQRVTDNTSSSGQRLNPWQSLLTLLWCAVPVLLGFILPCLILLKVFQTSEFGFTSRYWEWTRNTIELGGITALIGVALALLLAYSARLQRGFWQALCNRILNLGYAVPGAVIAVGILIPLARLDNQLADWMQQHWQINPGLIFTGSVVALVYAYLVRFFAVAYQPVDAGLARITPSMDASARSLGMGPLAVLRRVHVPLLSRSLLAAALLVFVEVMKELPATLVVRPFNYDTLAVIAHQFAADERLAEAALPALTIVLVGILPVVLVARMMMRSR